MKKLLKFVPDKFINKFKNSNFYRNIYYVKYYFLFICKIKKQLAPISVVNPNPNHTNFSKVLLPLIETNHYQFSHLVGVAKALEFRNGKVKILLCGEVLDGCELKTIKNISQKDPCWKCRLNVKNTITLLGLETIYISDILTEAEIADYGKEAKELSKKNIQKIIRNNVDLSQSIEDSVVRYFYGSVPSDIKQVSSVREAHIKTALMMTEVANRMDRTWKPDIVLSNMTCYSAWEPFYRHYKDNDDRFRQISITPLNFNAVVLDIYKLFPAEERFRKYLISRNSEPLSDYERRSLYEFIGKRKIGKSDLFMNYNYFFKRNDLKYLQNLIRIDKKKRNIFLFSNLYWDVGLSDRKELFNGVLDWVIQTVEIVKNNPNIHLYIKPHPAERFGWGSLFGVSDLIRKNYPSGLKNLTVIQPEWGLSTYELFPLIDVGVIYTGTLGLEMMLAGIPVISTGTTSHKGLGFALEPNSIDSYRDLLTGTKSPNVPNKALLEVFSYFYFILTLLPWTLTRQVYGDEFSGYQIESLLDLLPGRNILLDNICNCILDSENYKPETLANRPL